MSICTLSLLCARPVIGGNVDGFQAGAVPVEGNAVAVAVGLHHLGLSVSRPGVGDGRRGGIWQHVGADDDVGIDVCAGGGINGHRSDANG